MLFKIKIDNGFENRTHFPKLLSQSFMLKLKAIYHLNENISLSSP